jgi:hypothetical protein
MWSEIMTSPTATFLFLTDTLHVHGSLFQAPLCEFALRLAWLFLANQ